MKRKLRSRPRQQCAILMVVLILVAMACGNRNESASNDVYTCPMHPTVVSNRPATCPVCAMDLVRQARPGEEVEIKGDLVRLLQSPNEAIVNRSMPIVRGEFRRLPVSTPARGVVTYDSRQLFSVPARVAGRVEHIYLQYHGQPVKKGDRVAEIYSPELATALRELAFAREHDGSNVELIRQAEQKLILLGMPKNQIASIRREEPHHTVTVFSPHDGYVVVENPSQEGVMVKSGDYVSKGEILVSIVNPTAVRLELSVSASWNGLIKEGDRVMVQATNDELLEATVDLVQPFFSSGEPFTKIRIHTGQENVWRVGQFINATVFADSVEALWIPRSAVLDLGLKDVVFVKGRNGVFSPREVVTGIASANKIAIESGLASTDEIAANAHFMVDSEGFIKP